MWRLFLSVYSFDSFPHSTSKIAYLNLFCTFFVWHMCTREIQCICDWNALQLLNISNLFPPQRERERYESFENRIKIIVNSPPDLIAHLMSFLWHLFWLRENIINYSYFQYNWRIKQISNREKRVFKNDILSINSRFTSIWRVFY